jgi:hypothetical protein
MLCRSLAIDIPLRLFCVFHRKAVKGGGSKVSPLKKGDAGGERVKVEKQSLIETLPKPE